MLARSPTAVGLLLLSTQAGSAQSKADSMAAVGAARQYLEDCRRDGGRLWGQSLCGPLILVDGMNGFAVATAAPPAGVFARGGTLWIGRVPEGMQVANTAMDWSGQRWSTVRLPVPDDQFLRRRLLIHESFHRIQPALGLEARDAINGHLDSRDGRFLLRLELKALGKALSSPGSAGRTAVQDAALFRSRRHELFPGADTLENALEIQEGLAEYTGSRLALGQTPARQLGNVIRSAEQFATRPTYVRSLGYGTGPLLGLLLDRYAPSWRGKVRSVGMAAQLWQAVSFAKPADLAEAVQRAAPKYQGEIVAREEDLRAETQARVVADYRARLVDGPVIILRASDLQRSFNPNNLVSLGALGTVYPDGSFQAEWGALDVSEGGALVPPSNQEVRVPALANVDATSREFRGSGWTLRLNDGWYLAAGERPGDWLAIKRR